MMSNKLKLNAEKSHILTLGTKERLNNLQSTVCIKIEGAELTEDANKQEILLGCQISSDLRWNKHVDYLKKKLKKRLVAITLLKNIASFKTKKMILLEDCFKVFYLIAFLYLEAVRRIN